MTEISPRRLSPVRKLAFAALSIALGFAIPLTLAEIALRFLPVSSGLRAMPVNAEQPVFRFEPNRAFTYSRDWNFALANRGRINNDGWINDRNYEKSAEPDVIAVVGDSYVEALMVPTDETFHARLSSALNGQFRVYSFGASGAPLSQYLIWAQYATRNWDARALIINVVGNDFDESLAEYKQGPGFWHYVADGQGGYALRRVDYRVGRLAGIARNSALLRYLLFNLQILALPDRISAGLSRGGRTEAFAGNVSANVDRQREMQSLGAIDAFLRDLPRMSGLAPSRIAFTVDGFRTPNAVGADTYFGRMRAAFMTRARAQGFTVLDLDETFLPAFAQDGRSVEFENDGHWNAHGHALVARALLASSLFERWQIEAGDNGRKSQQTDRP